MSSFWSGWIMFLVVLNLGITLLLFIWAQRVKVPVQPDGTSGHIWAHGVLREGVRKLPLWWVLLSISMFAVGIGYLVLYPGFGSYQGTLGWTSHSELQRHLERNQEKLNPLLDRIAGASIEQLATDPAALRFGQRLFVDNCAACHGMEGRGNQNIGAPDLTDQDSLYGNDAQTLLTSILDGRHGTMPPMGGSLDSPGITNLANYVLSLSGASHSPTKAAAGAASFTVCAACHGADAKGNPALGAPNLTDDVWLYGGDLASIEKTIREGRGGVMPAWRDRLSAQEVKALAAWVYAQSHAEEAVAP